MIDVADCLLGQCLNPTSCSSVLVGADNLCSANESLSRNEELHQVIEQLNPQQPFLSFDLSLSAEDINLLNQMHIHAKQEYNNFGEFQNLVSDLKFFIESLAPENDKISLPIAERITKLVTDALLGNQQGESAFVIVRASIANSEFDLPDWHIDPCLLQISKDLPNDNSKCRKNEHAVIFSLKGPSTLFYLLPASKREEFNFKADIMNYLGNETHAPLISTDSTHKTTDYESFKRQELAKMINTSDVFSVNFGQGYVFFTGSTYGAVHSTPPIHEERLFIAIYPTDKDEVKKLEDVIKRANS